jgi:hypothetical protein
MTQRNHGESGSSGPKQACLVSFDSGGMCGGADVEVDLIEVASGQFVLRRSWSEVGGSLVQRTEPFVDGAELIDHLCRYVPHDTLFEPRVVEQALRGAKSISEKLANEARLALGARGHPGSVRGSPDFVGAPDFVAPEAPVTTLRDIWVVPVNDAELSRPVRFVVHGESKEVEVSDARVLYTTYLDLLEPDAGYDAASRVTLADLAAGTSLPEALDREVVFLLNREDPLWSPDVRVEPDGCICVEF